MNNPSLNRASGLRWRGPDRVALVSKDGSASVGEIEKRAAELACLLRAEASPPSCLLLPSDPPLDFLVGLIACRLAGATAVPWRVDAAPLERLVDVARPCGILRPGSPAPVERIDAPPPTERVGDVIMMTSGSTGSPKGVALAFSQLLLNASAAGTAIDIWECDGWAIDLDLSLMSAVSHLLMAWQFDLPLYHLGGLRRDRVAEIFRDTATGYGGSPIQLLRLTETLSGDSAPAMMMSSGDFLTPAMIERLVASFPHSKVHKFYGLTELAGRFCCMPHPRLMADKGAAGTPLPGFELRIAGETGEVKAMSPLIMAGYYHAGGVFERYTGQWYPTGDIGEISDGGVVTLLGRTDDVLKVSGEKVDRRTIENALADLLPLSDHCVLAVDHAVVGQCAALFIATDGGAKLPTWHEIVAHVRERLPSRFVPALVYLLPGAMPRLDNGKIDRQFLKGEHRRFRRLT